MVRKNYYNFRYSANMLTLHNTVSLDIWLNMLLKFSKQIANSFAKMNNGYNDEFKILSNIWDGAFSGSRYWLKRLNQNRAKHLRWSI